LLGGNVKREAEGGVNWTVGEAIVSLLLILFEM
jgi:hypothetical protein